MSLHERIDVESRENLELLLSVMPGGFNAIPDIVARRQALDGMLQELTKDLPRNDRVETHDRSVRGLDDDPDLWVRVYRPVTASAPLGGIYYIHGGGMILGNVEGEHQNALALCDVLGCVVVSVEYRLAPEHAHPAQTRDCYAGLVWMVDHAEELGIDVDRVALYGGSAGGGLAIATALMARDRGRPRLCYQMALYPMIDDRNETASSEEIIDVGIWDRAGNIEAWRWYLGGSDADPYAAPARADDVTGLPPTFIDVGELDLFRDEDITFAMRLLQAGVPTELHVYPGAYHASEVFAPIAALSQRIVATRLDALRRALG